MTPLLSPNIHITKITLRTAWIFKICVIGQWSCYGGNLQEISLVNFPLVSARGFVKIKKIFKFKCLKPRKSHNRWKRCLHSKCVLSDRNKFTELWIICNSNHFILKPNKIFFTAYIQTSQSRLTCQLNSQNENVW